MIWVVVILLVETLAASFASFFLKKAGSGDGNKLKLLLSPWFYLGGVLYVLSALGGIYLLQKLPYAIVLPLGSITYIWTMFVSRWLLKEEITKRKILGMSVIIIGVALVGAGSLV